MDNNEERIYNEIWSSKIRNDTLNKIYNNLRIFEAIKYLDKGKRILDIGCSKGELGLLVREKFEEIYGVDISEFALKIAEKNGVITQKVNLNYENLPYENNFFDAIVCLDVIEHIINPFHLLAEIKRVLKPQGVLILTTPNFRKIKNILYLLVIGKFPKTSTDASFWDGGHLHYFTFKDIKWLLKCHGFSIVSKGYIFTKEKYVIFKFFLEKLLPKNLFSEFIASGILVKAVKNP